MMQNPEALIYQCPRLISTGWSLRSPQFSQYSGFWKLCHLPIWNIRSEKPEWDCKENRYFDRPVDQTSIADIRNWDLRHKY